MSKALASKKTISISEDEYKIELYKTVKRQQFLLRLEDAEKNLRSGKVKKVPFAKLIENL